ncbi:MAG: BamA/TamA family outer membrane protein [Gemmatimonadaceae bacterium]|nr:BamA/TamA family outer membrane protein [Gemmatimonadaceae bacterium]
MPRLPIAFILLLTLATALPSQDGGRKLVTKMTVTGVEKIPKRQVTRAIQSEHTACRLVLIQPACWIFPTLFFIDEEYLDRGVVKDDIRHVRVLYFKRGYRRARVDTIITPSKRGRGVELEFVITEGKPTLVSSVDVTQSDSTQAIRKHVKLAVGAPFDLELLDSTVTSFRDALWNDGYGDAVVTSQVTLSDSAMRAAVQISIDPKRRTTVGAIRVAGNRVISDETIRSALWLKTGDLFRRTEVMASQRSLYQSQIFRRALIILPPAGDTVKDIEVTVQEGGPRRVRTTVGMSTLDFAQADARVTLFDVGGAARSIELRGVAANLFARQLNDRGLFSDVTPASLDDAEGEAFLRPTWQVSAEIVQPWLASPRNSAVVGVLGHRRSAPAVYIDEAIGAHAAFTREMAVRVPVSLSYRLERTRVTAGGDRYFCFGFGVCERTAIDALSARHRLASISLGGLLDRTNHAVDPTGGYSARIDLEHASGVTGSDFRYHRAVGEGSKFWRWGEERTIAVRLRGGWVDPLRSTAAALGVGEVGGEIVHPRKRFYAGGSQSVRGYGENELGPRVLRVERSTLIENGCSDISISDGSCDPSRVASRDFQPRSVGGNKLVEASVELRLPFRKSLSGAVFADAAYVGAASARGDAPSAAAITPGVGLRYSSGVGPIRFDVGLRPGGPRDLPVVVTDGNENNARVVRLDRTKNYDPLDGRNGTFKRTLDRLTFHLSMGQAF